MLIIYAVVDGGGLFVSRGETNAAFFPHLEEGEASPPGEVSEES